MGYLEFSESIWLNNIACRLTQSLLEIDMITTYKILPNLINIAMNEAKLCLCNSALRGSGLRLLPSVACTHLISNTFTFIMESVTCRSFCKPITVFISESLRTWLEAADSAF